MPANNEHGTALESACRALEQPIVADCPAIQFANVDHSRCDLERLLRPLVRGSADDAYGALCLSDDMRRIVAFGQRAAFRALTLAFAALSKGSLTDLVTGDTGSRRERVQDVTSDVGWEDDALAAVDLGGRRVIARFRDRATSQESLYGYNDGITSSGAPYGRAGGCRGSAFRTSRGVAARREPLALTHKRITGVSMRHPEGVDIIIRNTDTMPGGDVFIPRIPSMRVIDLASDASPGCEVVHAQMRLVEGPYEEMIPTEDLLRTFSEDDQPATMPTLVEQARWALAAEHVDSGLLRVRYESIVAHRRQHPIKFLHPRTCDALPADRSLVRAR